MATSLLRRLPSIAVAGGPQAEQILEQPEGQYQLSLKTRKPAILSKDGFAFRLWGDLLGVSIGKDWEKKDTRPRELLAHAPPRRSSTVRQENLL